MAFHSVAFQLKCLDFQFKSLIGTETRRSPLTFLQLAIVRVLMM